MSWTSTTTEKKGDQEGNDGEIKWEHVALSAFHLLKCMKCSHSVFTPASLDKICKAHPNAAFNELWTVTVSEFLSSGKVPDKDFVGHCYELRQQKRNCQSDQKVSTSTVWNSSCLRTSIFKINRMLHIPELNYFISSPLDGDINVHALCGQKHTYEGI